MSLSKFSINKPKMAWFLKFKFLILLKINLNGGQFYKKIWCLHKNVNFAVK